MSPLEIALLALALPVLWYGFVGLAFLWRLRLTHICIEHVEQDDIGDVACSVCGRDFTD